MNVVQTPKKIDRNDGVMYLRYSSLPIAKTKSYAHGEVNVDLDALNKVVGIEVLSFDADEFAVLKRLAQEHHLDVNSVLVGSGSAIGCNN